MRYAVINKETKEVINVIIWDGISEISGLTDNPNIILVRTDTGNIGDIYDENTNEFISKALNSPDIVIDDTTIEQILNTNQEIPPSEIYKIIEGDTQ